MTTACSAPGTHAGLMRHRRGGTPICAECAAFHATYQRERRAANAAVREQVRQVERRVARARDVALAQLAEQHPREYADLLARAREQLS